ncbi:MAG: metal-binding protein [Methanobacteriaceae archaeon]|nr:metal-binding protein [Methanobacteriaceae archaeon]
MKKQGVILVIAALLALILCGAVSATDSSTTGGEGNLDVNASEPVDPILWLNVGYEYADDKINPEITVTDSANKSVAFEKTKYTDTLYKLNFTYAGVANETLFNVMVSAPGYKSQTKQIAVNQAGSDPEFIGSANFNMQATENYKLGREVTAKADQALNFATADEVLCITTAGLTYRNGTTTEDCLEGILNGSNGKISYGQGNLLTLRKNRADPVDFAFITRRGTDLTAVFFKNGGLTPSYQGTFSENMSQDHWTNIIVPAIGDDAFGYVSLANAWAIGLSTDVLRQAAFHGHVCLGTISGQAMIQTLLKYYPPTTDTGLPLEGVSYLVLGVPGNSDDDAFVYAMDDTPGKRAYIGVATMAGTNMVGFIRWNSQTNNGTLVVMKFDEDVIVNMFKRETGLTAYGGISSELKFNKWLVGKLQNDPVSLVTIVKELDGLTEEQYHYLAGYEPEKGNTTVEGHGLDMDYINTLNLPKATRQNMQYTVGNLTPEQIKQIGIDAAKKAIELFKAMGITIEKDDSRLTVLTSAGYVRLNGQPTDMTWDGLFDILGTRLSRATLLPVHSALWKSLIFEFAYENGTKVLTKTMHYDIATQKLVVDSKASYSIEGVLLYDPPYDALMAWLFHNHICGGSSPGYLLTDYILDNYPVGEDEKYIYVTTLDNCKDDIISYLLGVSAGSGTYYNIRLTTTDTSAGSNGGGGMNGMVGIIIKWNEKLKIGTAAIINWQSPDFARGSNSYEEYIKLYKGDTSSANLLSLHKISVEAERLITQEDLAFIVSGGSGSVNSLSYVIGLPVRSLSDLIPVQGGSQSDGSTSQGTSTGSGLITSTGSGTGGFFRGSVGTTGAAVNAATQTTITEAGAQPAGDAGKSYEVTQAGKQGSDDTPWGTYAVVGILSVLALAGIGFFFKGSLFG